MFDARYRQMQNITNAAVYSVNVVEQYFYL